MHNILKIIALTVIGSIIGELTARALRRLLDRTCHMDDAQCELPPIKVVDGVIDTDTCCAGA